jgi:SAM-dependent methyltransferase
MNGGWGGGYVTDIVYDSGFYREQSPQQLQLATLLCGFDWDVPAEGAHYLELGCGRGIGALIIAASNSSWRVTALDFNPAHIAEARAIAREAGLTNITFIEADLSTFAESPAAAALPEADIVTMHGVWSWVSDSVRAGVLRLLRGKLRAGGVMHVSYNALPGWQGMLAVQRTVREAGLRLGSRSDRQAAQGLAVVRALYEAEASALRIDPRVGMWTTDTGAYAPSYLAHEFMNGHWSPCWHADVAAAMSEAQLDWVGAATLIENFIELAMTQAQRQVCEGFDDPIMQEMVKDLCLARTLRHDVYVRGARRLSVAERDAALRNLYLGLIVPLDKVALQVQVGTLKAELSADFYQPVAAMMARGPARVGDLLHAPGAVAKHENPAELAGLLVGMRQACVVSRPGAPPDEAALRLNAVLARRFAVLENINRPCWLASTTMGSGVSCSMLALYATGRVLAGEQDADVAPWVAGLAGNLNEEDQGKITAGFTQVRDEALPQLRRLGCLPG